MDAADEMAAKIEPTERQSADTAVRSDDKLDEHLLHTVLSRISHHLDYEASERNTIYDRLLALESEMKKRGSRGLVRSLLAICIGIAAILVWQFYGETIKQRSATPASLENTAVQASVPKTPQAAPVAQTAPVNVIPTAPASPDLEPVIDLAALRQTVEELAASKDQMARDIAKLQVADAEILAKIKAPGMPQAAPVAHAPSFDPEQVHQVALDLAALRQTVEELAASRDQLAREIAKLQAAHLEVLAKIKAPPPLPRAAPARKPMSVPPPTSRGTNSAH